jgi:hypothetical protein
MTNDKLRQALAKDAERRATDYGDKNMGWPLEERDLAEAYDAGISSRDDLICELVEALFVSKNYLLESSEKNKSPDSYMVEEAIFALNKIFSELDVK